MTFDFSDSQVAHFFEGTAVPLGAAVTYGVHNVAILDPDVLAQSLHALWATNIMPNLDGGCALSMTRVKNGPSATGPFATYSDVQGGGVTGEAMAPNVSILVTKNTAIGGRQGKGRLYLPGLPEASSNEGGLLVGTFRDALQSDFDTVLAAMATGDFPMSVLHEGARDRDLVTSLSVQQRVATQRRRNRR